MENFKWIFDGIGTAVITFITGLFVGGTTGYKIGINKSIKQVQKGGNNSSQTQIGEIKYEK